VGDFFETRNGTVYRNGIAQFQVPRMEALAPNPNYMPPPDKPSPEPKKKRVVRRKKSTGTKASTKRTTAKTPARATTPTTPKKPIPASSVQPRDNLGRFASKAWGVTKAVGGCIGKGVAHVGKSAVTSGKSAIQKKVKAGIRTAGRRRKKKRDLRLRAQSIKIRKQEIALGLAEPAPVKKRKVIRR
jgi:hypothetical protein